MNAEPQSARDIFLEAIEIVPSEQWSAFLKVACRGNEDLRKKVERLLVSHKQDSTFMAFPAGEAATSKTVLADAPDSEQAGSKIGAFKLMEKLGEGGMGVVYMAEQKEPVRRLVALKIVKPGMDSRQVIARFEAERQALAMMEHPNIARIIDAGTTELGRPYFVMELVRGIPINEFCDQKCLTLRERLELFLQVCMAVQHAHQKGIIHRDLKPTNVLVTLLDVVALPKVIDFGIAKAFGPQFADHTQVTEYAQFVGTPLYMSPEQTEMNQLGVDTRSDVYSLGVMLYELLTGTTPFDKDMVKKTNFEELRRMLREVDPPRPSARISTLDARALSTVSGRRSSDPRRISTIVRGELDWIVMKALEKDRSRRYESASAFAADVQRYLDDETVEACPPSTIYRLGKLAKRHRAKLATAALLLAMMTAGSIISIWQAIRATRAEILANDHAVTATNNEHLARAEQQKANQASESERRARDAERIEREKAEDRLYFADMRLNSVDTESANTSRLLENLFDHVPLAGEKDRRSWDWYYLLGLSHENQYELMDLVGSIVSVAWSPNGKYLATSSFGGWVVIYETENWKPAKKLRVNTKSRGLSWSPDSKHLSWGTTGFAGQVSKAPSPESAVTVFNVETENIFRLYGSEGSVMATAWSPDGEQLASAGMDLKIRIWNWKSRECVKEFPVYGNAKKLHWHPNLPRIAASITTQDIRNLGMDAVVIDINHGQFPEAADIHDVTTCGWNADGSLLALGKSNGFCSIYDAKRWTLQKEWPAHQGRITSIAWSKDSQKVITGGADRLIRIWNQETGICDHSKHGSTEEIVAIDVSSDGHRFATGDATAKIWSLQTNPPHRTVGDNQANVSHVTQMDWRNDSRTIDSITENQIIAWDIDTRMQVSRTPWKSGQAIGINAIGERFAMVDRREDRKEVFLCDLRTGNRLRKLCVMEGESTGWFLRHCLCFNMDASKIGLGIPIRFKSEKYSAIAVIGQDDTISDLEPYEKVLGMRGFAFSPDAKQIACIGESKVGLKVDSHLFLQDVASGKISQSIPISDTYATCLAWSHDGKRLATGDNNGRASIWDPANVGKHAIGLVHSTNIVAIDWHPSDCRIASKGVQKITIWDPESGQELIHLTCPSDDLGSLKWSPDGKCLAAIDSEGHIQLWDASPGYAYARCEEFNIKLLIHKLNKARELYELGKKDSAYDMLSRWIRSDSLHTQSLPDWVAKRWIDFASQSKDPKLTDLILNIFLDVHDTESDSIRVGILVRDRKFEEAESLMRKIFEVQNSLRVVYLSRAANTLLNDGLTEEAKFIFEHAFQFERKSNSINYQNLAWQIVNCPIESLRDGRLAVELAQKLLEKNSSNASVWNTLGIAYLRAGDWNRTIASIEKSMELSSGGGAYDWFFLAMAHHQLSHADTARQWFDKAVSSMKQSVQNQELIQFHAEAKALLNLP